MGIESKIRRMRMLLWALVLMLGLGAFCVRYIPGNNSEPIFMEGEEKIIEPVRPSIVDEIEKFFPRIKRVE